MGSRNVYDVIVTNGTCTQAVSITLTETTLLTATATGTNVGCNGNNNGTATASGQRANTPTHGAMAETTQTATGLIVSTYTVTIVPTDVQLPQAIP
ncbi:MAG: hypothetical protein IPP29_21185 [Bacteroidetes bacterium]|nr:hypothetical protein [Bacteroidota bacterium]